MRYKWIMFLIVVMLFPLWLGSMAQGFSGAPTPFKEDTWKPCKKLIDDAYQSGKIDYDTWADYRIRPEESPKEYWVFIPSGTLISSGCVFGLEESWRIYDKIVFENWDKIPKTRAKLIKRNREGYVGDKMYPMEIKIDEPQDNLVTYSKKVKVSGWVSALEVEDPVVGNISILKKFTGPARRMSTDEWYDKLTDIKWDEKKRQPPQHSKEALERSKGNPEKLEYFGVTGRNIYRFSEKVELKNYGKNEVTVRCSGRGQNKTASVNVYYYDDSDKVSPTIEVVSPKEGSTVNKEDIKIFINIKDDKGILMKDLYLDGKQFQGGLWHDSVTNKIKLEKHSLFPETVPIAETKSEEMFITALNLVERLNFYKKAYRKEGWDKNSVPDFDPDKEIDLSPGEHKLKIEVKDIGGNVTSKEVTIVFEK